MYIRFSSASFEVIEADLNVSQTFIFAIFESALLKTIGADLLGQQIVRCETVTS